MAEAVELDPGSYPGTYKLVAGTTSLDFANLVSYRGTARHHDWLEPRNNLKAWVHAAGVDAAALTGYTDLREFREVIARTFLAIADGTRPENGDVDRIGALAASAWSSRRLRLAEGSTTATWEDTRPRLLWYLALDAAELLTSSEAVSRIRACDECRWLFLDTTRNRSRRWCDAADCGNRARQRRHYQRRS